MTTDARLQALRGLFQVRLDNYKRAIASAKERGDERDGLLAAHGANDWQLALDELSACLTSPPPQRFATDEEVKASAGRVMEKHRKSLEKLAALTSPPEPAPRLLGSLAAQGIGVDSIRHAQNVVNVLCETRSPDGDGQGAATPARGSAFAVTPVSDRKIDELGTTPQGLDRMAQAPSSVDRERRESAAGSEPAESHHPEIARASAREPQQETIIDNLKALRRYEMMVAGTYFRCISAKELDDMLAALPSAPHPPEPETK